MLHKLPTDPMKISAHSIHLYQPCGFEKNIVGYP